MVEPVAVSKSRKAMSVNELTAVLAAKVTNSLGYFGGKLSQSRIEAMEYYNGEPFGNEQEGRSKVVSRDVAEAVDAMMPSLMKIFTSGEEAVRFNAQRPTDEAIADQATDYVNWIWMTQNDGFRNTYDWFKDSLLNRSAAIKIWWDEQETTAREKYDGLSDDEFLTLMKEATDESLEIISHDEYPDPDAPAPPMPMAATGVPAPVAPPGAIGGAPPPAAPPAPVPAMPIAPMPPLAGGATEPPPVPMLHDVVLRRTNKSGRVRVLPIPGEEFLIDRRAVSLEDTPFTCHRQKKTISDLIEMGFDKAKVDGLGTGDAADFDMERLERFHKEDDLPSRTGGEYDPSMREVWINECYIKIDYDGDGVAELRKIIFAGDSGNSSVGAMVILDNEEIDDHPFCGLTPNPMPHKFFGVSVHDQVKDLQLIKSTLWRAALDHTYNAIMPQLGVVEGQVNLDDLLTRRPGGIVRMQRPDAVVPLPAAQMGVDPFQMISYVDSVREQRTGVQRFVAGPGADSLNNAYTDTATGANLVENATQERIELVARCFAELGFKPAFRKILKLVTMHQNRSQVIRLRGKWVEMDPRDWDTEFDTTVTVGLGTGNRAQQLQGISSLLNIDKELIMQQGGLHGPLVTAENVYNKLDKMCQYIGLKGADSYYTDPASEAAPPPPQPRPDPQIIAAQIRAQADQQKQQAELQADAQKYQAQTLIDHQKAVRDAQFDAQKLQMQMEAERQRVALQAESDERIAMAKIQAEREVQYARIAADREEFNASAQLQDRQHATDISLKREQMGADHQFKSADHALKVNTTPGAKPLPKIHKVTLIRGQDGFAKAAKRHYDDGSDDTIHIDRLTDLPGPLA